MTSWRTSSCSVGQSNKPRLGIPALEVFNMVARNPLSTNDPSDGHADLFVTIPRKASALRHSPFSTPFTYYSRCFWTGTTVPTWRDPAKNARSRELFTKVIERCAEHGWVSYRTNPAFQDLVISKYSFNNNSLLRFQERLKDAIDPNGIISPGRYGIWPAHIRKNRP